MTFHEGSCCVSAVPYDLDEASFGESRHQVWEVEDVRGRFLQPVRCSSFLAVGLCELFNHFSVGTEGMAKFDDRLFAESIFVIVRKYA